MIHLLQALHTQLSDTSFPVYLETVPQKAKLPYIVFSLPNSLNVESDRQDYTLQVDVWDNIPDNTRIDTITNNIDSKLHKLRFLNENLLLILQRENRLMIPDPDPSIRRRQLRYLIKTYER
jgi:hypothetical protein